MLLQLSRMEPVLAWAARTYDRVVIDSPPLNLVADAVLIGTGVDGVIVVARSGVTPFDALAHVTEVFRKAGLPVLGTVMNDIDYERDADYDGSYRWYGYGKSYYAGPRS